MIRIAIVEDEQQPYEALLQYIQQYAKGVPTFLPSVVRYTNAENFLEAKSGSFDLVYMDIQLPGIDGMEASKLFREKDSTAVLVFITNMAQYAIKGYEVDALDFVLKPISYPSFKMKLPRILKRIQNAEEKFVALPTKTGIKQIRISDIRYIEVRGHRLYYNTVSGIIDCTGSLSDTEKRLEGEGFSRCNNCYLVNLNYITEVRANEVVLSGEVLAVSRTRKKVLMDDLARRIGE